MKIMRHSKIIIRDEIKVTGAVGRFSYDQIKLDKSRTPNVRLTLPHKKTNL